MRIKDEMAGPPSNCSTSCLPSLLVTLLVCTKTSRQTRASSHLVLTLLGLHATQVGGSRLAGRGAHKEHGRDQDEG